MRFPRLPLVALLVGCSGSPFSTPPPSLSVNRVRGLQVTGAGLFYADQDGLKFRPWEGPESKIVDLGGPHTPGNSIWSAVGERLFYVTRWYGDAEHPDAFWRLYTWTPAGGIELVTDDDASLWFARTPAGVAFERDGQGVEWRAPGDERPFCPGAPANLGATSNGETCVWWEAEGTVDRVMTQHGSEPALRLLTLGLSSPFEVGKDHLFVGSLDGGLFRVALSDGDLERLDEGTIFYSAYDRAADCFYWRGGATHEELLRACGGRKVERVTSGDLPLTGPMAAHDGRLCQGGNTILACIDDD